VSFGHPDELPLEHVELLDVVRDGLPVLRLS
jgi:hypothetical protein